MPFTQASRQIFWSKKGSNPESDMRQNCLCQICQRACNHLHRHHRHRHRHRHHRHYHHRHRHHRHYQGGVRCDFVSSVYLDVSSAHPSRHIASPAFSIIITIIITTITIIVIITITIVISHVTWRLGSSLIIIITKTVINFTIIQCNIPSIMLPSLTPQSSYNLHHPPNLTK